MDTNLYKITEICDTRKIESSFIQNLHHSNLISIIIIESEEFINEDDLPLLERYCNWYYDLELNVQGIEIVRNLLEKIQQLNDEIRILRTR